MNAVLVFGGRQWNSSSLFSYERDHPSSKKTSSVMKSWSNLGLKRRNKFEQVRKKNKKFFITIFIAARNTCRNLRYIDGMYQVKKRDIN